MQNKGIEKKVEETLESLNGMRRAAPPLFLLTRINAKIKERTELVNIWTMAGVILTRPMYTIAGILFIILINVIVISRINNSVPGNSTGSKDEFVVNVVSIYDIENLEP